MLGETELLRVARISAPATSDINDPQLPKFVYDAVNGCQPHGVFIETDNR